MERHKLNNILFTFEISFFVVCAVVFALLGIYGNVSNSVSNIIYIFFITLSFGYLFALEFAFPRYDNAVHFKDFA